jgi:hypothetical protein
MTDQEIIKAIAAHLMGWHIGTILDEQMWVRDGDHAIPIADFDPLTDPAACASVLNEIERRGWSYTMKYSARPPSHPFHRRYIFDIFCPNLGMKCFSVRDGDRHRAICLAALKALGIDVG